MSQSVGFVEYDRGLLNRRAGGHGLIMLLAGNITEGWNVVFRVGIS